MNVAIINFLSAMLANSALISNLLAASAARGTPITDAEWASVTGHRDDAVAKFDADIASEKAKGN